MSCENCDLGCTSPEDKTNRKINRVLTWIAILIIVCVLIADIFSK